MVKHKALNTVLTNGGEVELLRSVEVDTGKEHKYQAFHVLYNGVEYVHLCVKRTNLLYRSDYQCWSEYKGTVFVQAYHCSYRGHDFTLIRTPKDWCHIGMQPPLA